MPISTNIEEPLRLGRVVFSIYNMGMPAKPVNKRAVMRKPVFPVAYVL
jgi:hypothetical protein